MLPLSIVGLHEERLVYCQSGYAIAIQYRCYCTVHARACLGIDRIGVVKVEMQENLKSEIAWQVHSVRSIQAVGIIVCAAQLMAKVLIT